MEIRVYLNLDKLAASQYVYRRIVDDLSSFSFDEALRVMKSLYGRNCVVTFVCV